MPDATCAGHLFFAQAPTKAIYKSLFHPSNNHFSVLVSIGSLLTFSIVLHITLSCK
jgi:hypothetical protein